MEQLRIERLGHLGDGIAPGSVFVPGTLPGELVAGDVVDGVMAAPRIVEPSDQRVRPPCTHAKACGGCQLQHAHDDFTAAWKQGIVVQALAAHGLTAPFRAIVTSPPQTRRRATFSVRRTKKGALAGFHMKRSDVIVAVPQCQLVRPVIAAALPLVEALALLGASRKSALSVSVTDSLGGLDIAVTGGKAMDSSLYGALADLARQHDLARLTWEDDSILRRPPEQQMGAARIVPPPGTFLQATAEGEAALRTAVMAATEGARHIVDLFAGCGTFTFPLASTARVHAVEGTAAMIDALDIGMRNASGIKPVTHAVRDLFRNPLLVDELVKFDAVVIDPPRAGAAAQIEQIALSRIPRLAHVSCNPVTFARDTAHLVAAGYAIDWVQVVDQFRWSTHVELIAALRFKG